MRALTIAWKDFRHAYRNIAGLAMMLVAPLLLATALGAAFGSGDTFTVAAVKTILVDQDSADQAEVSGDASGPVGTAGSEDVAGAAFVEALMSPALADLVSVTRIDTPEAARRAVDSGDAAVAVIIPVGLSEALMGAEGQPTVPLEVEIYKDPALNIGPAIVTSVVQSVIQSLNGAYAAATTSIGLASSVGITDPGTLGDLAGSAAAEFASLAQARPTIDLDTRSPVVAGAEDRKDPNVASQVLVGMMIFFMLFGASTPARTIIDEHREGTLPRLFTTPTSRSVILGGKYISVFLVVLIQAVLLLLAGWLLLGAQWGELGPVIALTLCTALTASALGLMMVSFARTPAQAGAVSAAVFVFLGLLGGNFVGSTNIGGTFALVRRLTPNGWLIEGWDRLLFGGSWGSIALPAAASLGFTVVLFAVATFFFRRRYA